MKKILNNFTQEECEEKYKLLKAGICPVCGEKDKGKQDPVIWEVTELPEYLGIEMYPHDQPHIANRIPSI